VATKTEDLATKAEYVDLNGRIYVITGLHKKERELLVELESFADANPPWHEYENFWMPKVAKLYERTGLTRRQIIETCVYQIAQDIGGRLGIAQGIMRESEDYRDELEHLILSRFKTRREFCEATGLSEDMLSHVLARRKHLAIDTLNTALEKVGYTVHIAPLAK
jgi:hypothetical protein